MEDFSIIHRKPYFLDPRRITAGKENVRWDGERNGTIKEVMWEERKEMENKGRLLHFLRVLIYILPSISVWCSSRATLHFPASQTGLFWWMTHQSITPVTETAHLTKAHLCHMRKSSETVSHLLRADPPHTRKHFSTLSLCICISMYTDAIVSTRCVC